MKIEELKKLTGEWMFRSEMTQMFFEAMLEIAELPDFRTVPPFVRESWKVVNTPLVTPLSSWSGGTTVISFEDIPVWMMQYLGQYNEKAIPCLKAALRAAYMKKEFVGGRGPRTFKHKNFMYQNSPGSELLAGIPGFFAGEEKIRDLSVREESNWQLQGWHRYQGGLMI